MLQYLVPADVQPCHQVCRLHCPAAAVTDSGDATRAGDRHAGCAPEEWGVTCNNPLQINSQPQDAGKCATQIGGVLALPLLSERSGKAYIQEWGRR